MVLILVEGPRNHAAAVQLGLFLTGHESTRTRDPRAALELVEQGRCDALLVDWELEPAGALAFLDAVRGMGYELPTLVMAPWGASDAEVRTLDAGAEFLPIPHDLRVLGAKVRALRRRAAQHCGPRVLGRIAIDHRKRAVLVDGEPCPFTARELDLLQALAERPGTVATRAELIARLGWVGESAEHNLDQQVSNVRRKLGAAAGQLQTVRGLGFRLVPELRGSRR